MRTCQCKCKSLCFRQIFAIDAGYDDLRRIPYSLEASESELVYDFSSYSSSVEGIAIVQGGNLHVCYL